MASRNEQRTVLCSNSGSKTIHRGKRATVSCGPQGCFSPAGVVAPERGAMTPPISTPQSAPPNYLRRWVPDSSEETEVCRAQAAMPGSEEGHAEASSPQMSF